LEFETSNEVQVVTSFNDMGLKEELLRGIYSYGFDKPSAMQQHAVVPILLGRDVVAQAQSGTGKTSMIAGNGLGEKAEKLVGSNGYKLSLSNFTLFGSLYSHTHSQTLSFPWLPLHRVNPTAPSPQRPGRFES
jgi:hypothetical protein